MSLSVGRLVGHAQVQARVVPFSRSLSTVSKGMIKFPSAMRRTRRLLSERKQTTLERFDSWLVVKFPRLSKVAKNRTFRITLRVFRIGAAGAGLYSVGRAQGMHDYARDPEAHDRQFIFGALGQMGARSVETNIGREKTMTMKLDLLQGSMETQSMTPEYKRVERIGKRLIAAATTHVKDVMLMKPIEEGTSGVKAKVRGSWCEDATVLGPVKVEASSPSALDCVPSSPPPASSSSSSSGSNPSGGVPFPTAYRVRLRSRDRGKKKREKKDSSGGGGAEEEEEEEGVVVVKREDLVAPQDLKLRESLKLLQKRWQFWLYQSKSPNAFVQGMLPCKVFVSTGLLHNTLCENDDQVAMVLGHELAHTILDHAGEGMDAAMAALLAQVVLLSLLDPTGVVTFLFEVLGFGAVAKYAYLLPAKRCHESEADDLGLIIAAKACFNPSKAIGFFEKLHALEKKHERDSSTGGRAWTSDHPPTADRSLAMKDAVAKANGDFKCNCAKQDLAAARASASGVFGVGKRSKWY